MVKMCLSPVSEHTRLTPDQHLLVDPVLLAAVIGTELLGLEPESNLLVGRLHSIGAMADVTTNLHDEDTLNEILKHFK